MFNVVITLAKGHNFYAFLAHVIQTEQQMALGPYMKKWGFMNLQSWRAVPSQLIVHRMKADLSLYITFHPIFGRSSSGAG